jgi:hypothetical protein
VFLLVRVRRGMHLRDNIALQGRRQQQHPLERRSNDHARAKQKLYVQYFVVFT